MKVIKQTMVKLEEHQLMLKGAIKGTKKLPPMPIMAILNPNLKELLNQVNLRLIRPMMVANQTLVKLEEHQLILKGAIKVIMAPKLQQQQNLKLIPSKIKK